METLNKLSAIWKIIIAIVFCESVGIISGLLASANSNLWFETLNKPSWNPPAYLFGPVWTTLYLLMGISLSIIWNNNSTEQKKRKAYFLFAFQLFLNFWWSFLFFSFHLTGVALIEILLLWIAIIIMISLFFKVNRTAALLQIPYLLWVTFAIVPLK